MAVAERSGGKLAFADCPYWSLLDLMDERRAYWEGK
jgi:hypothetical protein